MGEEPTESSDISGDNDDNTVELVVDEMANSVAEQSEGESLKKEIKKKKELEKEKEKQIQLSKDVEEQMKNTEERIKHLKELEQVEKTLKNDLQKSKMERHNLSSWQDQSLFNTHRGQVELTESNLNSLDPNRAGGDDSKEFDATIQTKRYFLLDKIRINSVNLATYHNHRYHVYKNILFTIFRVPLILLAGLNSFFSVGLQSYMAQHKISLITAVVSLFCGILTSIELLLNLQKRMEMEQETAKAYYKLAVEIYNELGKAIKDRGVKGDLRDFLKTKFNDYQNLFAAANTVNMSERNFIDEFELYIDPDNADGDDCNMETGTVDGFNFTSRTRRGGGEFSSDDSDGHERDKHNTERRISKSESSTLCPECCKNLFTSCMSTMFYCCLGSEKRIEIMTKKERQRKHKERKTRLGISKAENYTALNLDSYV
tara:strand:- start:7630 stop:8919 length:1290 start_codon:yes stop_codon:yes gene_type:complete